MSHRSFLTFIVAGTHLAIDARLVKKTLGSVKISHAPHALSFVHGLTNYRGEVVTLLDLPYMLGLRQPCDTPRSYVAHNVITLRTANETDLGAPVERIGFCIDQLNELQHIKNSDISLVPDDDSYYEYSIVIEGESIKTLNIRSLFIDDFYSDEPGGQGVTES